jgi:Flp pilus assembly pilin Flp
VSGDLLAIPIAVVAIGYHYTVTLDVRRTMRRIAAALEALADEPYREPGS